MESIQEFLKKSLQTVDLKTVTKADLKQMYLKEQGIAKLSKEERKLFSTAVESAYIDFMKTESSNSEEIIKDKNAEVNGCKSDSESASSDVAVNLSHDSGLGASHIESLETLELKLNGNQVTPNDENVTLSIQDSAETSKYGSFHDSLKKRSVDFPNGSSDNNNSAVDFGVEKNEIPVVDTSGESNDEPILSKKNSVKNSEEEKEEPVADTSCESDDEPLLPKKDAVKISKKKKEELVADISGESDDEPLLPKKNVKKSNKKKEEPVADTSGESDDEPLLPKKDAVKISKEKKKEPVADGFGESDDEPLLPKKDVTRNSKGKKEKPVVDTSGESDDEPLLPKKNVTKNSVSNDFSSDSDDVPLIQSKKRQKKTQSNALPLNKTTDLNSSDTEDECLINVKKQLKNKVSSESDEDFSVSKKSKKLQSNLNKPKKLKDQDANKTKKKSVLSDSEEEELLLSKKAKQQKKSLSKVAKNSKVSSKPTNQKLKPPRRIQKSFLDSSDSDELPLISVKAQNNPKNSLENSFHERTGKDSQNNLNRKILSDSDNESLIPTKKRKRLPKPKPKISNVGSDEHSASDSDEPLSSLKTKTQVQKSMSKPASVEANDVVENNEESTESNLKNENNHSQEDSDISADDSDEYMLPATKKTKFSNSLSGSNVSGSDEEPIHSVSKDKSSVKISPSKNKSINKEEKTFSESNSSQLSTHKMDTSDSDEEPLSNLSKKDVKEPVKSNNSTKRKRFESSSDESEVPIVKKSKSKSDVKKVNKKSAADSEDEPLASIKSNIENEEDSSMDENEEKPIVTSKSKGATKVNKAKEQKKQTPSAGKLENLKKYIRAAGIKIKSYEKLFENCKSMKSKSEKLLHLLEKEGLKGRPTLAKCKKLKKKIETKKEVAELDVSNIISSGRPKRTACSDTTNRIDADDSDVPLAKFSRLKGIIDSEESD